MSKPQIGFAGLGAMGGGMATNLVKNNYTVTGYDVYQPLVDKFVSSGGKPASTPAEAAKEADIFISMVQNAEQNTSLLFEGPDCIAKALGKGKTFVLCSTTSPSFPLEIRKRLDEEFHRPDILFLDCPVSGGTFRAADGNLSIFSSGPTSNFLPATTAVLETMAGNLYNMGALSNGTKTKTIHQLLAATNIISACEALALAATVGLNTRKVYDHLTDPNGCAGASFFVQNRVPHMLTSDWSALSALSVIFKDTTIVTSATRAAQCPAPLANTAHTLYLQGIERGMLKEDDAKLVQLYLPSSTPNLVADKSTAHANLRSSHQISADTIADLLAGIHLAASLEAMQFCKALDQDRRQMCEIISKAAGWNEMFTRVVPGLVEGDEWGLGVLGEEGREVGRKLGSAVGKCLAVGFPCPMGSAALAQFQFAALGEEGPAR